MPPGGGALLTKDREPEAAPLLCGLKVTLNDTPWPAPIVIGKETPGTANWELLMAAEETVTLALAALRVIG